MWSLRLPSSLGFATLPTTRRWGVKGTSLRSQARYTLKAKVFMGFFVFSSSISKAKLTITVGVFAIRDPRTCCTSLTGRQPAFGLLNIIEGLCQKLLLRR